MKCQALFSLKNNDKKKFKILSVIVNDSLRVDFSYNICYFCIKACCGYTSELLYRGICDEYSSLSSCANETN